MAKPLLIQTKADWHQYHARALARTAELAKGAPAYDLLRVVREQLEFMGKCVQNGRAPFPEEYERIDIGPIAVHNFEETDEQYATWLKELDYAFRTWRRLT